MELPLESWCHVYSYLTTPDDITNAILSEPDQEDLIRSCIVKLRYIPNSFMKASYLLNFPNLQVCDSTVYINNESELLSIARQLPHLRRCFFEIASKRASKDVHGIMVSKNDLRLIYLFITNHSLDMDFYFSFDVLELKRRSVYSYFNLRWSPLLENILRYVGNIESISPIKDLPNNSLFPISRDPKDDLQCC